MTSPVETNPRRPKNTVILGSVLLISVIWGSTFLAYKISFESFPPFTLAALRFIIGGGILLAWGLHRVRPRRPSSLIEWRAAAISGAALFLIGNGAVVWSQTRLTSGVGGLVVATIPIWTALFVTFVRKQPISKSAAIAVGTGFLGLIVVSIETFSVHTASSPTGLLVAVAGVVAWSIGSLYTRSPAMPSDPILAAGMQMLCGGILLVGAAAVAGEIPVLFRSHMTSAAVIALLYLAIPNAITFGIFVWLIEVADPIVVSSYAYISPVVAVLLGWGILSEPVTWRIATGSMLVLASVFVLVTPARWSIERISALLPAPVLRRATKNRNPRIR